MNILPSSKIVNLIIQISGNQPLDIDVPELIVAFVDEYNRTQVHHKIGEFNVCADFDGLSMLSKLRSSHSILTTFVVDVSCVSAFTSRINDFIRTQIGEGDIVEKFVMIKIAHVHLHHWTARDVDQFPLFDQ